MDCYVVCQDVCVWLGWQAASGGVDVMADSQQYFFLESVARVVTIRVSIYCIGVTCYCASC